MFRSSEEMNVTFLSQGRGESTSEAKRTETVELQHLSLLSQANTDLYGRHIMVQNKRLKKGQMFEKKKRKKNLGEPVWKTKSFY